MKNLFLTVVLLSFMWGVKAQEDTFDGRYVVGGGFNFISQKNYFPSDFVSRTLPLGVFSNSTDPVRFTFFSFSPYVGKEIHSRLLLGSSLFYSRDYNYSELERSWQLPIREIFESLTQQVGLTLFSRHTFNPDNAFQFFAQPSLGYYFSTGKVDIDSVTEIERQAYYLEVDLGLGMLYNINKRLRATLRAGGLSYINGEWKNISDNTKNSFSSFSSNFRLSNFTWGLELRL